MLNNVIALLQTAWLFMPANDRVVEVRTFAAYEQAPQISGQPHVSMRRSSLGVASELSVYPRTFVSVRIPFVYARGVEAGNIFYDRRDLGDIDVRLRYKIHHRTSVDVGVSFPGASDTSTLENDYPTTNGFFPPVGTTRTMLSARVMKTYLAGPWRLAARGGLTTAATRFTPIALGDVYALWSTQNDGFSAGPYFQGRWGIDDSRLQQGIVGLMERIGLLKGFSLEVKLETTVFSTATADTSGIHAALVWRQ